jgi:hypothetical protein
MCICDSKKTKTVPESMRGRTWGSLLPPFSLLAKNDPSQVLSKSKYVLVKTNDYMIFFADEVLYPVEWRIFCVFQHII